jgi:hypothetical protein
VVPLWDSLNLPDGDTLRFTGVYHPAIIEDTVLVTPEGSAQAPRVKMLLIALFIETSQNFAKI